jgi:hypothetical protein
VTLDGSVDGKGQGDGIGESFVGCETQNGLP